VIATAGEFAPIVLQRFEVQASFEPADAIDGAVLPEDLSTDIVDADIDNDGEVAALNATPPIRTRGLKLTRG